MNKTGVLLKKHYRIVKLIFLGCFINEMIASFEYCIVFYAVSEVLNHCWKKFLIFNINSEAEIVKFPSSVDVKIVGNFTPLLINFIGKFEVRQYYA